MRMPFGEHQGKDLEEIPSGYLKWAAGNVEDDGLASACDEEWRWRQDHDCHWYAEAHRDGD